MVIDAHQHFWKYDPIRDAWIESGIMDSIKKDFLPSDLMSVLKETKVERTIAIQASQSEDETHFLLNLADEFSFIAGVVGWIDLLANDLGNRLEIYRSKHKLLGFRHIIQSESDGFMMQKRFIEGIRQLKEQGYCFDILVYAHQLPEVVRFIDRCPDQRFVLDHIGKPDIRNQQIKEWEKQIRLLAESPNLFCKISGMITEADWKNWTPEMLMPYLDVILDSFGPQRCMFGSDWPVCQLAGSYKQVLDLIIDYTQNFSRLEKAMIFGGTCKKFYKIPT